MKNYLIIIPLLLSYFCTGQEKINVYLLPGQGADCRLFAQLKLDTGKYEPICLSYTTPMQNEHMSEFAHGIAQEIDTSRTFYLVGVSLGGMIATEIAHQFSPERTIVISSAKNRTELPIRYKFQQWIPLYRWIAPERIKKGALFLQPIVEPAREKYASTFSSMLSSKPPLYFQRTIAMIVNWNRKTTTQEIIHIHGTKDHTIPLRNIENPIIIQDGSHMMTLTKAEEISNLLSTLLE